MEYKCPFTGEKIPDANQWSVSRDRGARGYSIKVGNHEHHLDMKREGLNGEWASDKWFRKNGHLVKAAMYNGLSLFGDEEVVDLELVKQRVQSSVVPHTAKMKLDTLLKFVADELENPGEGLSVEFPHHPATSTPGFERILNLNYLKNKSEFIFYAQTLAQQGYVELSQTTGSLYFRLTYRGLAYLASLEDEGTHSKNCFVAMAFSGDRADYRSAIISAIEERGYTPIIIDDRNIDSDKTINDQIIAEIRKCKFCVSDFTLQRNGVYFEAGFALGLGKPVIYICDKDDFVQNSHFDLKPFQHILYTSVHELQKGLSNKIAAWIQ